MLHKLIFVLLLVGIVGLVAAGAAWFLNVDDLIDCAVPDGTSSRCAPADVIVAISGGDTSARTAEAIALYKDGWASKLVFSGAAQDASGPSNAEAMRKQALRADVPEDAILIDTKSVDTMENATHVANLVTGAQRVIVVTSPYHQRRAHEVFKRQFGPHVAIVSHPTTSDRAWPSHWWLTLHGWWLALSEVVKTSIVMVQK